MLTGGDAATAINIGAGSSASELAELGLSVGGTSPTNLLTQGAAAAGQTLTLTVGANPPLTVTFGSGSGEVSTLTQLQSTLQNLAGGTATVDPTTGNISVTALNGTDQITVGGTASLSSFGLAAGSTGPTAGTQVSISEDAASSVFGLKLASASSTLTGASVAGPTGSPPALTIDLANNPQPGETLTVNFSLPDGTSQSLTLTATNSTPPGSGQFTIGATAAATATNLQSALTGAVSTLASTSLTAASAVEAANEFFGDPPMRVDGPPFSTATSLTAGTSANTVQWYTGEDGSTPALATATAQIDPGTSVSYGMRANEQALRTTVENVALFAAMSFSASDPNSTARYSALTQRVATNIVGPSGSQTVSGIADDVAQAQTAIQNATTNNTQTTTTLQDMLQNIVGANSNDVGAQILSLQSQLQASLQVTALLAKTNLVSLLSPLG